MTLFRDQSIALEFAWRAILRAEQFVWHNKELPATFSLLKVQAGFLAQNLLVPRAVFFFHALPCLRAVCECYKEGNLVTVRKVLGDLQSCLAIKNVKSAKERTDIEFTLVFDLGLTVVSGW